MSPEQELAKIRMDLHFAKKESAALQGVFDSALKEVLTLEGKYRDLEARKNRLEEENSCLLRFLKDHGLADRAMRAL